MVILKYIFTFALVQYELYFLNIKPNLMNRRSNRQMKEKRSYFLILVLYLIFLPKSLFGGNLHPDVVVAGGGASGVSAALQSARMGMRVRVVAGSMWLGGMLTTGSAGIITGNVNTSAVCLGNSGVVSPTTTAVLTCVLIVQMLRSFHCKEVDIHGNNIK